MGKGSTIKSLVLAEGQICDLRSDMIVYATYIEDYKKALIDMWTGDGVNSYWQGENAYEWFDKAYKEFNNLVLNYGNNYKAFKSLVKTYVKSYNKAKKNKKSPDQYIQGVPVEKYDSMLSEVPATVNKDAVSDTENDVNEARKAFTALNAALTSMIEAVSGMLDGWSNVKINTTGDLQNRASKRYDFTLTHKNRLKQAQEDFTSGYTMDQVFSDEDSDI